VSLASKMADDVAAVDKLSEMLRERARPFALKELDDLKAFAGIPQHTHVLEVYKHHSIHAAYK
jgi:Zn-dependent oligopeptidase